jgi:hypothetical protein
MLCWSKKISKNYVFEISGLHKIRLLKDGVSGINFDINWDRYKADHNPKFTVMLTVLNFKIIEISIYNVNHVKA